MTDLILPNRYASRECMYPGRKPMGNVKIDWSHPMTRGLTNFVLMNTATPIDLVTGEIGTLVGTPEYGGGDPTYPSPGRSWFFTYVSAVSGDGILLGKFKNTTGDLTVITKVKWTGFSAIHNIVAADESTAGHRVFQFRLDGGNPQDLRLIVFIGGSAKQLVTTGSVFPLREDQIVGFTHDSAVGQNIYLEGVSVASASDTGNIDPDPSELSLGCRYDSGPKEPFNGNMSFMGSWQRALSAGEHLSFKNDPELFLVDA